MRAGVDGFTELGIVDDVGEPVVGAPVPDIPPLVRGRRRLAAMMTLAMGDALERIPPKLTAEKLPVLLCTREAERPGPRMSGVVAEVEDRLGLRLRRDGSDHLPAGHVAAFEALLKARQVLSDRSIPGCLIVAVDSLCDRRSLDWLDRAGRLKRPSESDGVIPGEAACVALITREPATASHVLVRGVGTAAEAATVLDDRPLLGQGMAAALKAALAEAGLAMHEIDFRLSDAGGESYGFEELVLAQQRLTRAHRDSQILWQPAAFVGDCAAAAGLLQLAWAEQAFARGYAPGPTAVAQASAAGGARAAAVLSG
jgi:3-oxoacyl-[acyl-carrier-protein] synthase-1